MSYGIDLEKQINEILTEFNVKVDDAVRDAVKDVAKQSVKKIKSAAPKKSGQYARGWTYKVEAGRLINEATIYGKRQTYPLAHLLEHGHAKRGGGRVGGIEHIKPVEDWAVKELEDRIRQAVEGIT